MLLDICFAPYLCIRIYDNVCLVSRVASSIMAGLRFLNKGMRAPRFMLGTPRHVGACGYVEGKLGGGGGSSLV